MDSFALIVVHFAVFDLRPALSPAPFGTAGFEMGDVLQSSYGLRQHQCDCRWQSCVLQFTVYVGPGGSFSPSPTTQEQPSPYFPRLSSFCSHFLLVALSSLLSMPGLQTFWSSLPIIRSQCSARPAFSDLSQIFINIFVLSIWSHWISTSFSSQTLEVRKFGAHHILPWPKKFGQPRASGHRRVISWACTRL